MLNFLCLPAGCELFYLPPLLSASFLGRISGKQKIFSLSDLCASAVKKYYCISVSVVMLLSSDEAQLTRIHNTHGVQRIFYSLHHWPGCAILFFHQPAQFEADSVMIVQHAAML